MSTGVDFTLKLSKKGTLSKIVFIQTHLEDGNSPNCGGVFHNLM